MILTLLNHVYSTLTSVNINITEFGQAITITIINCTLESPLEHG